MKDQAELSIPVHLQELLQPTPSGTAKLIAAWDGLTPETQIALLAARKMRAGQFDYFYCRAIKKALTSDNAFVRYLAAREMHVRDRDEQARARIDSDPDPLVRYAHLEEQWRLRLDDPVEFFALPHEARLAKVRRLRGSGEEIANLISHAVEHQIKDGKVSEMELLEMLSDYLNNPEFRRMYFRNRLSYDPFREYSAGKDIEALWNLVLKVPEGLSHVIIEHLPASAGLSSGIPKEVLDRMSDRQLETLFDRSDIGLETFRKQKFFECAEGDDSEKDLAKDAMWGAAVTNAFDLSNEEFAEILSKPDKLRVRVLTNLAVMAEELRLCLFYAIHDILVSGAGPIGNGYDYAELAKRAFERKLEQLKGRQRHRELRELKLYRLAVEAVPWAKKEEGYRPTGELAFLEAAVVEGDTWATFVAFCGVWDKDQHRAKRLQKHLPKIWKAGEEDHLSLGEEEIDEPDRLADRVANNLSDFLITARGVADGEESKLAQALGKLSGHAAVAQEKTLEAVNSVKSELAQLKRSHNRQRVLFWIVIGLLVVLPFVGR